MEWAKFGSKHALLDQCSALARYMRKKNQSLQVEKKKRERETRRVEEKEKKGRISGNKMKKAEKAK